MRRDKAVLRFQKGIIPFDRLRGYDIQSRGVYLAAVKSVCQILLDHQLAAAVVDQDHAIFHPCNTFPVDHSLCIREQRAVQEDYIGLREELVSIHICIGDRILSFTITLIPMALSILPVAWPILPNPMMPAVFS